MTEKPQKINLVKAPKKLNEMTKEEIRQWAESLHAAMVANRKKKNQ